LVAVIYIEDVVAARHHQRWQ
jgi:hypothetical protein